MSKCGSVDFEKGYARTNCMVFSCKNRGYLPGVSYFWLNKSRYQSWMKALRRDPSKRLSRGNAVCSDHFLEEDKIFIDGQLNLKPGAVPKLKLGFNPSKSQPTIALPSKKVNSKPSNSRKVRTIPSDDNSDYVEHMEIDKIKLTTSVNTNKNTNKQLTFKKDLGDHKQFSEKETTKGKIFVDKLNHINRQILVINSQEHTLSLKSVHCMVS